MTLWRFMLVAWDFDLSIVIGCAALLAVYFGANRFRAGREALWFTGGVLALLLALVSPLDPLSDTYLFSAHMLQHLILVLIVPPMLLLGISRSLAEQIIAPRPIARVQSVLGNPMVAWTIGNTVLWIWHLPVLFSATLANEGVHIFEHLCFLVSATIFWWPLLSPIPGKRMDPLLALAYLFAASLSSGLLGIILTFAPASIYPAYLHPQDSLGILPSIRTGWGLTPEIDQALGGLLMWVGGGVVFLAAIIQVLVRWYREGEPEESAPPLLQRAGGFNR